VVLLFVPADFVPACTAEWTAVRDANWNKTPGLAVIGISGDSLFSHAAYANEFDLPFPLVSDFHGGIAETYDLLAEKWEGHSRIGRRATVVRTVLPQPLSRVSFAGRHLTRSPAD